MSQLSLVARLAPRKFVDLAQDPTDPAMRLLQRFARTGGGGALLLHGPPGSGKTGSARVLAHSLSCPNAIAPDFEPCGTCPCCDPWVGNRSKPDHGIYELDCALESPADLMARLHYALTYNGCFYGSRRQWPVIILDEVHRNDGRLGDRILKTLEDEKLVCFLLLTSEPEKLSTALKQRCRQVKLSPLTTTTCTAWLEKCSGRLGWTLAPGVASAIARESGGSPRMALQILESAQSLIPSGSITLDAVDDAAHQMI